MMDERKRLDADADELDEVKRAFISAHGRGEANLQDWLRDYPQHAPALLDLAFALDLDASSREEPSDEEVAYTAGALRKALEEVRKARAAEKAESIPFAEPAPGLVARMRECGLSAPELARELSLTSGIVFKLDRGFVLPDTVPQRLTERLATALNWPTGMVTAAIRGVPATASAMYYAKDAPRPADQQSFAEALVHADDLSPEDCECWLEALRAEGLVT